MILIELWFKLTGHEPQNRLKFQWNYRSSKHIRKSPTKCFAVWGQRNRFKCDVEWVIFQNAFASELSIWESSNHWIRILRVVYSSSCQPQVMANRLLSASQRLRVPACVQGKMIFRGNSNSTFSGGVLSYFEFPNGEAPVCRQRQSVQR